MFENYHKVKIISHTAEIQLLKNAESNPKHKLIILLMLDTGLRVSEVASLRLENFDFKNNCVVLKSLKKRSGDLKSLRSVPLSVRIIEALSTWYIKLKDKSKKAFIFPANSKEGHITRTAIWKLVKRKSNYLVNPHMLRHTFATKIVNEGNTIRVAQNLLGHKSMKTTEIYLHVVEHEKIQAIKSIDKRSKLERLKAKLFPRKNVFKLEDINSLTNIHVGRIDELKKINELYNKKINIVITGKQGIGKSHLLEKLKGEKILRLDDFSGVKKILGNILLFLKNGDKENIINLLRNNADLKQIVTRESSFQLIELISQIVKKNEYTLLIDDLTHVTKGGIKILEKLKNIFHIVTSARRVKVDHSSFLTNFEHIRLEPLPRSESISLIVHLSRTMRSRIEDFEHFKNHVYDQTNGNPLFIYELVDRFSKEHSITISEIRALRHSAALKEIDMSVPILIILSSLMVMRYIGGEFEDDSGAFKLFGGIFMIFALFARSIFTGFKRKYI